MSALSFLGTKAPPEDSDLFYWFAWNKVSLHIWKPEGWQGEGGFYLDSLNKRLKTQKHPTMTPDTVNTRNLVSPCSGRRSSYQGRYDMPAVSSSISAAKGLGVFFLNWAGERRKYLQGEGYKLCVCVCVVIYSYGRSQTFPPPCAGARKKGFPPRHWAPN